MEERNIGVVTISQRSEQNVSGYQRSRVFRRLRVDENTPPRREERLITQILQRPMSLRTTVGINPKILSDILFNTHIAGEYRPVSPDIYYRQSENVESIYGAVKEYLRVYHHEMPKTLEIGYGYFGTPQDKRQRGKCNLYCLCSVGGLQAFVEDLTFFARTFVHDVRDPERFNARKDTAAAPIIASKKKKNTDNRWTNRTDKQGFSHTWLLTSLKGHTGQVLDMDFASNGKYLASCAEAEPDPGDDLANPVYCGGASSSGSECNKENNLPSSAEASPRAQKPLSRRQRKNRRREDSSSPESKKKSKGVKKPSSSSPIPTTTIPVVSASTTDYGGDEKKCEESPSFTTRKRFNKDFPKTNYYHKLNLKEFEVYRLLRSYLLSPEQMLTMGYPVECVSHPGQAIIFKSPIEVPSYRKSAYKYNKPESKYVFDVNAREFVPNTYKKQSETATASSESSSEHDSGNLSDSNDSESSDGSISIEKPMAARTYQQALVNGPACNSPNSNSVVQVIPPQYSGSNGEICHQKTCVRCGIDFYMNSDYTYLREESCVYHWGKLIRVFGENRNSYDGSTEYTCCNGKQDSKGCTEGKLHVWNGIETGFNGPFDNYAKTRPRRISTADDEMGPGAYALDCEMCYSTHGMELVKVSVVSVEGKLIYDVLVKPENEIVDYNTRFSGITAKDIQKQRRPLRTLREVQNDLLSFISAETILIGHGLESDLRVLRILHPTVIDTAVAFPHYNGLPYRRSLKSLTWCFLKREIQTGTGSSGHDSYEDALACMDLMLWRVRKDFKSILDTLQRQGC